MSQIQHINIKYLEPHPDNPRIMIRQDVVDGIAAGIESNGGFNNEYALRVRLVNDHYQIISGHHRFHAAKQADISELPCWVVEMSDDDAYMALVMDNNQGELKPLEIGLHVLGNVSKGAKGRGNNGGMREYGRLIGKSKSFVHKVRCAAEVFSEIENVHSGGHFLDLTNHLSEIHATPRETWPIMVQALIDCQWSTKDTASAVKRVNAVLSAKPEWWHVEIESIVSIAAREPGKAKQIEVAYAVATQSANTLETVTVYRHEKSDETETIDGRDYEIWKAVGFEYDQRQAFIDAVLELQTMPTRSEITGIHKNIIANTSSLQDQSIKKHPKLSDEEYQQQILRENEMARIQLRDRYTPRLMLSEVETEMLSLLTESIDLICIDPPYNIDKAEWDSFGSGAEYAQWAEAWLKQCYRLLRPTGAIYVFGVNRMLSHIQHKMDNLGFVFKNWITWDTIQGQGSGLWPNRQENILYYGKTDETYEDPDSVRVCRHEKDVREYKGREYKFKSLSNVWRCPCVDDKSEDRTDHPTQKPLELIERIIKASSPPDGLVLDCFAGSGTTLVAAMKNNRRSIGIEKEQSYMQIIKNRIDATEIIDENSSQHDVADGGQGLCV